MANEDESNLLAKLEQLNRQLVSDNRAVVSVATLADEAAAANSDAADQTAAAATGPADTELLLSWGELLAQFDTVAKKKPKRLAELVHQGIPSPLRGLVWAKLTGLRQELMGGNQQTRRLQSPPLVEPDYVQLLRQKSSHEKQIRLDISRTFPNHNFFAEREGMGQEVLFNVIKAYSMYDTEVGYCQGSPFIVGLLLMHMPEEEAFRVFVMLMRDYHLRGLFRPSMADLPLRLFQLEGLIGSILPAVGSHFAELGITASMYASRWFLTLFASALPLKLVFRIFDVFLLDGLPVLFQAAITILAQHEEYLLRQGFEEAIQFITHLGAQYTDQTEEFIAAMIQVKMPLKRLQKLERDYEIQKVEEQEQESELSRTREDCRALREENKLLRDKVVQLETETNLLADRLLQKAVLVNDLSEQLHELRQRLGDALDTSIRNLDTSVDSAGEEVTVM